ncbi:MAG: NifU family protein [Rhodoglobus sp.]
MSSTLADRVENVLDEAVRPWLAQHAGNIRVDDLADDGVLQVRLSGRCSGCPTADLEVTTFVTDELRARLPEISDVVLVSGVSDELMTQARSLLALRTVRA